MNEHFRVLNFLRIRSIVLYSSLLFFISTSQIISQQFSFSFSEKNAHEVINILESELKIDFNYDYDIFDQSLIEDFSASGSKDNILAACFTLLNKDFGMLEDDLYVIKQVDIPIEKKIDAVQYQIKLVDDIKTELAYGVAVLDGLNTHFESDLKGELNIDGFFSPEQMIHFSYLGFETLSIPVKQLKKNKKNIIVLKEEEHMLDEIVIRDKFLIFENAGLENHIISDDNSGVGGSMDHDALQRSQAIAGVYNTTESLSDLQIRGGISGQTQLQWNNIELYQSNLFLGNISSINPFMADVIKVNKNGGSADDQGNSSGSIHMQSDHYSGKKSEVKLYSDLLYMNAGASTTLFNNKVRIKAAVRNSITSFYESKYYDQLYENIFQFGPIATDRFWDEKYKIENPDNLEIQNEQTFDRNVNFGDYSFSILAKPSSRMTVDINYLNIYSDFSYEQIGDYDGLDKYENRIENQGISAKLKYQIAPFWKSNVVFSNSSFSRVYNFFTDKDILTDEDYNVQDNGIDQSNIQINQIFKYKNHEWKIGVGHQRWEVSFADFSQYDNGIDVQEDIRKVGTERSVFLDYTLTIADLIKFRNGTRWSDYSLTFDKRIFIEPRIHVSLLPTKHFTVHAHYGTYHRNLNRQFQGSSLQVEGDFWYISDEAISDPNEWLWTVDEVQYSIGARYAKGPFSVELDGYRKLSQNIWSQTFEFENEANPYQNVDSKVRGIELSLSYKNNWVSISNTYELMDDILVLEDESAAFKNPYFQPFKTSLNTEFRFKQFKIAALWNYGTGRYYSEPTEIKVEIDEDGNDYLKFIYGERLNRQLGKYHRLDISCFYKLNLLNDIDATFGLSVINLYNRQNITSATYGIDWNVPPYEPTQFDREGLPFMPNASLLLEF